MHNHLSNAKRVKNDEFYTLRVDVDAELAHYTSSFDGKVVFCNCDDDGSAFMDYFVENFHALGLQGLYCSGIAGELFEYDGSAATVSRIDGDFRSSDSTAIIKQSDIIATNMPFSLSRKFFSQLLEHGKDFLVIANKNAISYKEVFPAIKDGVVRLGYTTPDYFQTPSGTLANLSGLSRWFTTLPTPNKTYPTFTASFNDRDYQHFDLYPAMNVDKTSEIPCDYDGLLGVPITALDKLDPEQFDIVELIARYAVIDHSYDVRGRQLTEVKGKPRFSRLIINKLKNKKMKVKPNFRIKNNQNSVYRPKQQTNAKYGDFGEKAERPLIIIVTALFTGGISYGFHCLRENKKTKEAKKRADYISAKKAEDRKKRREEEQAAREQAEREADEKIQNQVNDEANAVDDPKPANEVVSSAPEDIKSTRLYADLVHKGNIAVVFGPKGEGKSIFTTQMLAGIVKGTPEVLFPGFGQQHEGQHGIVIDFEQSPVQLKGRYGKEGYRLPENLDIVCGKAFTKLEAFKAYLRKLIGKLTRSTVIGIDNLSKALPILQDESARDLFRFLSECIESAKRDKGIDLTFVLVAHTNKEGYGVSIGTEHLKGTSKVADFADLVLAIGPTRFGKGVKMLKVLHNRNEPEPETVLVMKKVDSKPYLHFEPVSNMREEGALPNKAKNVKREKPCEDNEQDDNEQQPEKFTHEEKVEMWKLNKEEHLSYEKIAAKFKKEGKTTSRQNVGIYVRAIEDEMESSRLTDSAPDQQ